MFSYSYTPNLNIFRQKSVDTQETQAKIDKKI